MATSNRQAVYRHEDDELLGYVEQRDGTYAALTIFGATIATATTQEEATAILHEQGLSVLTRQWEYFEAADKAWLPCMIIEASTATVRVARMDGPYPDTSKLYRVEEPIADNLRLSESL
jgi:hypothetical protein